MFLCLQSPVGKYLNIERTPLPLNWEFGIGDPLFMLLLSYFLAISNNQAMRNKHRPSW